MRNGKICRQSNVFPYVFLTSTAICVFIDSDIFYYSLGSIATFEIIIVSSEIVKDRILEKERNPFFFFGSNFEMHFMVN